MISITDVIHANKRHNFLIASTTVITNSDQESGLLYKRPSSTIIPEES
jgi:hypothetical protein